MVADDRSGKVSLPLKPTIVMFFDMQTVVRIKSFALIAMLSNVTSKEKANQRSSLRSLPTDATLFRLYHGAQWNRRLLREAYARCEKGPRRLWLAIVIRQVLSLKEEPLGLSCRECQYWSHRRYMLPIHFAKFRSTVRNPFANCFR